MAIYVVRLNDGSCMIGEASSESAAREEFLRRWDTSGTESEEVVLSVREMPKDSFVSRWWPSADDVYEEGFHLGDLEGSLMDDSDVYENEYPAIFAAHEAGSDAIAKFSDDGPIGPTLTNWEDQLRANLKGAVGQEMRRGKTSYPKNVQ
jgi:hypothetical protein